MLIRVTQIDGELPNLALMRLAHYHRSLGDEVHVTRRILRDLFEPEYDVVYGSAIFEFSAERLKHFQMEFPGAIVGGSGTLPGSNGVGNGATVEQIVGDHVGVDYSGYPGFVESVGFTQRGCRLKCKFCGVPGKEGKPRPVASIRDIWRGDPHPRKVHLLDNDFFGQPEADWRARIDELSAGDFRVCFGQGVNVRLIKDAEAAALASVQYRDTRFQQRRLYTAWDNLRDERVFFEGVDRLQRAGVPPSHLRVYMLIGFDPLETWERLLHRFNRMVALGIEPYPMVYNNRRKDLRAFQRWVVTGLYRDPKCPWEKYRYRVAESVADVQQRLAGIAVTRE